MQVAWRMRARHQHRGQHEHQRARPEAELAPDHADALPFLGADPHPADRAEDQPGHDHGDHAGNVQVGFGQGVGEVGQRHAERDLGGPALIDAADHDGRHPTQDGAHERPADELDAQVRARSLWRPPNSSRGLAAVTKRQQRGEERDGRGVVEQAFALDQQGQPSPGADLAEHRRDGAGVGGGDDRGHQQADAQAESRTPTRRRGPRRRWSSARRQRPGSGSARRSSSSSRPSSLRRGIEQQDRQKHPEQQVGLDVEQAQLVEEIAHDRRRQRVEQHVGEARARRPRRAAERRQQDGVGKPQPGREARQEGDQRQEAGDSQRRARPVPSIPLSASSIVPAIAPL